MADVIVINRMTLACSLRKSNSLIFNPCYAIRYWESDHATPRLTVAVANTATYLF